MHTATTTSPRLHGARLRSLREHAGLSVRDVAAHLGVTESYVYGYENGSKVGESVHLMIAWLALLGADANYVFGLDHIQPDYSGLSLDHRLAMYIMGQVFKAMDQSPGARTQLVESMLRAGDDSFLVVVRELLDSMLEQEQSPDTLLE